MNPLSILNRILSGEKPDATGVNRPREKAPVDFAKQVWDAPALYNRATRRRVGLWGRIWRWDTQAIPEMRRTYVPRYLRRHFKTEVMLAPKTRRQRKARARIMRVTRAKGLMA